MLTKQQKKDIVIELASQIKSAKAAVFSDFGGLRTADIQTLRQTLRKEGVSYKVVKLTLLKRAMIAAGLDVSGFDFTVPLSVSLSNDDELAAARILQDFSKKHDKLKIVSGVLDGQILGALQVKALASLPTKQQLLGQLVGVIASPLRGLASVLSGNMRGLINVLNAKSKLV